MYYSEQYVRLKINVFSSCHKHLVVFSHNQHRRLRPAMCHNLRDGGRGPPAPLIRSRLWRFINLLTYLLTYFTTPGGWPFAALTQAVRPDIGSESPFLTTHMHSMPLLKEFPSEYCYAVCHVKTRMAWLPDGEKNLMICLFVLTWSMIWCWIIPWPRNRGYTSLKVIQTGIIRKLRCGFLFAFHSNYGSILHQFRDKARR